MNNFKCGCGKDGRYVKFTETGEEVVSCNKYSRCLDYDVLLKQSQERLADIRLLIGAANSLRCFREGTYYYKEAEQGLFNIANKYGIRI